MLRGRETERRKGRVKKIKRRMTERMERYLKYMDSDHWARLRKEKLKVFPLCEHCSSDSLLHVHHVNYRDYYSCLIDDLVTLCESCHDDLHIALRIKGAQSEDYPAPMLFNLIADYRRGDLGTLEKAKKHRRREARILKKKQKRENRNGKVRNRRFTTPISKVLNDFWRSNRGLNDLIRMRNQLSLLIDENDDKLPDVVSIVLNHGMDRLPTVAQLE